MPLLLQPRPPLIVWLIRHNTWQEVTDTTIHHENHEASRTSIDGCGTNDVRVSREEGDNRGLVDQDRRLIIEWTTSL
jgi:hypothetical protein